VECYSSDITITNNLIENNSRAGVEAMLYSSTLLSITDNVILNNLNRGVHRSGGGGSDNTIIARNMICYNRVSGLGGGINGVGTIANNSIIGNSAEGGAAIYASETADIINNLIIDNYPLSASDTAVCTAGRVNGNNVYNNTIIELYNMRGEGSPNLDATNNYWGTTDEVVIQAKIYDWFDDSSKGIVDYSPYLFTPDTTAPISPPTGLTATAGDSGINLSWSANPETDLAGYKVYYDTYPGYPYDGAGANEGNSGIDVGDVTSYLLSGLTNDVKYYIAITAYDTTDDESWYSNEVDIKPTELPVYKPQHIRELLHNSSRNR